MMKAPYLFLIKIVYLIMFSNCSIQRKWWTCNTKHYSSKAITYYFGLIWKYIVEPEKSKIVAVIFVSIGLSLYQKLMQQNGNKILIGYRTKMGLSEVPCINNNLNSVQYPLQKRQILYELLWFFYHLGF